MARGKSGAAYTVSTDVTSGDPEGLSTSGRTPTITNSPGRTSSTIQNSPGRTPTTRKNSPGQSPTTKMLQPEMSDMPMSAMSREISTRRQRRRPENDTQNDDQAEDIAKIKEGHSIRGAVMKVVRLIIPHVALMTVFFIYLAFGAWVFYTLESNCSEECQSTIYEAKIAMVDIARNGTDCNRYESTPRPPQGALGRTSSPRKGGGRGMHSNGSDDCEDEMMDKIDEHFDHVMKMMVRSGMTVGKMDSYLVGRTWNLTSAMLFSMTTITTIGYGDITPETTGGRVFCIIYSIFGIPLALLCLANIGNLLARLTLKICRTTHHWLARHKVCARCRKCRRPTNHPDTSSQRRIMNGDVEIPMENFDKPPPYESQVKETKNETKTKQTLDENTNDHTFARSVSIATERPTSHPHGVTKQPGVDPCELQGLPPCGCEPNKCRCEHKPDVLEEVPLLVVVVILVVYMCGGAAWMASAEGWDFGTGIYFMFITLTTIGFGDVLPMKHYGDNTFIPCLFFTLFGLAIMSMCIALVQVKVLRGYQWVTSKTGLC